MPNKGERTRPQDLVRRSITLEHFCKICKDYKVLVYVISLTKLNITDASSTPPLIEEIDVPEIRSLRNISQIAAKFHADRMHGMKGIFTDQSLS